MKKYRNLISYAVILILAGLFVALLFSGQKKDTLRYSDVIGYFRDGKVKSFEIDNRTLKLIMENPDTYKVDKAIEYRLYSVDLFLQDVKPYLTHTAEDGTITYLDYNLIPPAEFPAWLSILPYLLFGVIMAVILFVMFNQMNGNAKSSMNFGRARLNLVSDSKKKVTFADVAGAKEEKEELMEVVEFLRNPDRFTEMGARIPRGILLEGPPGTGKTYLARATSGEAGVPFFSISGSDFVELYVGVGASRVRDTFEQAKRNAPCIVFIDEIDAVGRQRGAGLGGGNDEREQTLNQLLVEMDGFEQNEGIIVMAATNRPDVLDSALLRPGRFDRQIVIHLPDVTAREEILKIHARNKPLGEDVNLKLVARSTAGFSPADLENILNEAALLAARKREKAISGADIDDAILKVYIGVEKKSSVMTPDDKKLTAFHEAGHAVVTAFLAHHDPVHEVSIIPRGVAGGYTYYVPKIDKTYQSRNEMLDSLVSCLGGRTAEELCMDDVSTGASGDLQQATSLARNMITRYGMSDAIGMISLGSSRDEIFLGRDFASTQNYSEATAAKIDAEIRRFLDEAHQKAKQILTDHRSELCTVANTLIEKEKITGEEFYAILGMEAPEDPMRRKQEEVVAESGEPASEETSGSEQE